MKKIIILFTLITTLIFTTTPVFAFVPSTSNLGGYNLYPISDLWIGSPSYYININSPYSVTVELDFRDVTFTSTVRNIIISGIEYDDLLNGLFTNIEDVVSLRIDFTTSLDDTDPNIPYYYNDGYNLNYFNQPVDWNDYLHVGPFYYGFINTTEISVYTIIVITVTSVTNPLDLQSLPDISAIFDKTYIFRPALAGDYGEYLTQERFFNWISVTADEFAFINGRNIGWQHGYNDARFEFGKEHNGDWITASSWGTIEYNRGLSNDFDYFEWMYVALSFPALVLNIEIWPGFKLGYFVLISVIFGLIAWVINLGRRGM